MPRGGGENELRGYGDLNGELELDAASMPIGQRTALLGCQAPEWIWCIVR
jgi:hypothetical protein